MIIFVEGVGCVFVIERGKVVIGRREKRQFMPDFLHHRKKPKKKKKQEKGDADVSTFFLIETGSDRLVISRHFILSTEKH